MDALKERLHSVIRESGGEISLSLKSDYGVIDRKEDVVYSAASTIKIPILMVLSRLIREGKASWDQVEEIRKENRVDFSRITELDQSCFTLKELARWMIYVSDNTATNQLIDFVGMEKVNEELQALGATKTVLQRKMMDVHAMTHGKDNLTTAKDMVRILENITDEDRRILIGNRDEKRLLRYVDEPLEVAKKSGSLDRICHDVGVFYLEDTSYTLAILTRGFQEEEEAEKVIGLLSKMIYEHIKERSSESKSM